MTLIQLLGDVGSGKTLFSTYLASLETRPVYANYKIDIPTYRLLVPEILVNLNESSLVILDEAYSWLESRTSGKHLNKFMSYILFQSRKRGIDMVLTDQLLGTIDVRFRQMTNYEIHCRQIADVGFEYRMFKLSGWVKPRPVTLIFPYQYAERIFPLYDSWELINPIDDELIFNVTQDKTEIIKDVDEVAEYLLSQYDANDITKGIVADYCLRNGYPKNYTEHIYNSLKARSLKSSPSKGYRLRK